MDCFHQTQEKTSRNPVPTPNADSEEASRMSARDLHRAQGRGTYWLGWTLATTIGSTIGAMVGGALITIWLQPFAAVSSPLAAAAISIPRTAGALAVWGVGIGIMQ